MHFLSVCFLPRKMVLVAFAGFRLNTKTWAWSWRLDSWESIACHVGLFVLYAIIVEVARKLKPSKPPAWLNSLKFLHNAALSVVSFWMFAVQLYCVLQAGRLSSPFQITCGYVPNEGLYGIVNFVYLVSKLWEWADTVFLVLDGKPVIILHYFHHMTTFAMAAFVNEHPVGAFCMINCLVHTLMYAHYAKPQRWIRPYLTSMQIVQFLIVITIQVCGMLLYFARGPSACFNFGPVLWEALFNTAIVVGFLLLFVKFFIDNYVTARKKQKV